MNKEPSAAPVTRVNVGELDLETYALIVAHIRHFAKEPPHRVLARFGITPGRWASHGDAWLEKLEREAEADSGFELASRFGAVYGATLSRLKKERPRLEGVCNAEEPPAGDGAPGASASQAASASVAPGQMSVWQVSTDAAANPHEPRRPPPNLDVTAEGGSPPNAPVLPFGEVRSAEFADQSPDVQARLPAASRSGETVEVARHLARPTTPFEDAAEERRVASFSKLMPDVAGPTDPVLDEVDVDATIEAAIERAGTLPFGARPSPEFTAWLASRETAVAEAPLAAAEDVEAALEGTVMIAADTPIGPALPFQGGDPPSSPTSPPMMAIDRYASLCAALSVFPARTGEILERFGVADDEAKGILDRAWRDAFVRSPADLARWQELFTKFCAAITGRT